MKITVEVSDEELKETVLRVVANEYHKQFSADRRNVNRIVSECVKDIIYKDKEIIIDRIVAQASSHCESKAVKRLLDILKE